MGAFNVQFHYTNLSLKMPKWTTKCSNWQHVAKKWPFKRQNIFFGVFTDIRNAGVKAFMKLTPAGY